MANINKILLPRRGQDSLMHGTKKNTILEEGELFIEYSDDGVGKGHIKIKIGDGTTPYYTDQTHELPYALGDTSNDKTDVTNVTSGTLANNISKIKNETKLKDLFGFIKRCLNLLKTNDETINTKIDNITAAGQILYVTVVDELPNNPDPNTLYLIRS